ncbi:MAG: hypothetical protein ACLP8X_06095 [Streptosporangiaceae bacterium]
MTITLNGSDLTVTQVVAVARHGEAVVLAPAAMRQALVELVTRGDLTPADPARLYSDDRPIPCPHAGAEPGPGR